MYTYLFINIYIDIKLDEKGNRLKSHEVERLNIILGSLLIILSFSPFTSQWICLLLPFSFTSSLCFFLSVLSLPLSVLSLFFPVGLALLLFVFFSHLAHDQDSGENSGQKDSDGLPGRCAEVGADPFLRGKERKRERITTGRVRRLY